MAETLTLDVLHGALAGSAAAFRCITDLQPAGGSGDKVFPPTYLGAVYAEEERLIDGQRLRCVILDSVQSQANRLEAALLEGWRAGRLEFPLVQIDFGAVADPDVQQVGLWTALDAPHRLADAHFLASEVEEDGGLRPFRHRDPTKASSLGRRFDQASPGNATPLLELCPTGLLFGMWDSHGPRRGSGERFPRALVSEIVGIDVQTGVRPASRIDRLIPSTADMPIEESEDGWRIVEPEKGKRSVKLSKVGLGNVTPSLVNNDTDAKNPGGVTLRSARQTTVLSLPAIRRLRFPGPPQATGLDNATAELAARTALVALGLAAVAWQWRNGFDLRSRCLLVPQHELRGELLDAGGARTFSLDPDGAAALLTDAAAAVRAAGFAWTSQPVTLRPNTELVKAVRKSREQAAVETA